jgi:hypothetical protein
MGLSRTTALLDLSLTFPFDHFFFLLDQVSQNPFVSSIHSYPPIRHPNGKRDLPGLGTGLRGGSLLGYNVS